MRTAEITIALALAGLSIFFMTYAVALPIGWIPEEGPGGGAFPFWLSAIMLVCAAGIAIRAIRAPAGPKFFDPATVAAVGTVAAALLVAIAIMAWAGTYVAVVALLIFYLRIYGGHGWGLTAILTLATPVALFFFFEVTLKILLPKGITQPLFIPLYAMFF